MYEHYDGIVKPKLKLLDCVGFASNPERMQSSDVSKFSFIQVVKTENLQVLIQDYFLGQILPDISTATYKTKVLIELGIDTQAKYT